MAAFLLNNGQAAYALRETIHFICIAGMKTKIRGRYEEKYNSNVCSDSGERITSRRSSV